MCREKYAPRNECLFRGLQSNASSHNKHINNSLKAKANKHSSHFFLSADSSQYTVLFMCAHTHPSPEPLFTPQRARLGRAKSMKSSLYELSPPSAPTTAMMTMIMTDGEHFSRQGAVCAKRRLQKALPPTFRKPKSRVNLSF